MYRPTVRYSDVYRNYINQLFRTTTLDRNQILRLAFHVAAHSGQFKETLSKYIKGDVPLPHPTWELSFNGLWLENSDQTTEGGKYVNAIKRRENKINRVTESSSRRSSKQGNKCDQQIERQEREIPIKRVKVANQGGITIKFG